MPKKQILQKMMFVRCYCRFFRTSRGESLQTVTRNPTNEKELKPVLHTFCKRFRPTWSRSWNIYIYLIERNAVENAKNRRKLKIVDGRISGKAFTITGNFVRGRTNRRFKCPSSD